jgi:hypothetical protein
MFSWLIIGATVTLFVFTWIAFSAPGGYDDLVVAALYFWFLLGLVWLIWVVVLLVRSRIRIPAQSCRCLSHFPVFVLLMVLAVWLHAPLWLGYIVSRPAMDRAERAVLSGKRDPSTIHWIGIYPVSKAWTDGPGDFTFTVKGTETDMAVGLGQGFSYSNPSLDPSKRSADLQKHMSGHWYQFYVECCGA